MSLRSWLDRPSAMSSAAAKKFLTIAEVAELLGLSISHVRRLVSTGALPAHRVGVRALRIAEADIAAFLATRRRGT